MKYTFNASGHVNIRGTHKTTLEITKDTHLTEEGDCIIAVNADFDYQKLKPFLHKEKIEMRLNIGKIEDTVAATVNPDFSDGNELVIRLGDFNSKRTFAVHADKAAFHLKRELMNELKNPQAKLFITIESE